MGRKSKSKKADTPFSRNLVELMAAKGFTNKKAAEAAGTSTTSIHDWRSGVCPTDHMAVKRLADALGVSMSFLLTGEHDVSRGDRAPTISELFASEGAVFDGYLKVRVEKLIQRNSIRELVDELSSEKKRQE